MTDQSEEDIKRKLSEKVDTLSTGPGVYLMKSGTGDVIYVGKAKNLKKRVASYFKRDIHTDMKTGVLVKKIEKFDTILTVTEQEALILEANLIRKHKPRYNVILKDDKRYPLLRIDTTTDYPNITIARKMKKDGALYFGPYASAGAVHQTVKFINKTFKLRKCNSKTFRNRTRPCMYHQIGVCLAPCCLDVDKKVYRQIIDEVAMFLKGRTPDLIRQVRNEMADAASEERYEDAAQLRDKIFGLERTLEKQHVVSSDMTDRDVISVSRGDNLSLITLMSIRGGVLSGSRHFQFHETMADDADLIGTFITQYYEEAPYVPGEILVSVLPHDFEMISDFLKVIRKGSVSIAEPMRGDRKKYVDMAKQNGAKELEDRETQGKRGIELLVRLKKKLEMEKVPLLIECFDNSNMSGKEPVSAMVVFKDGKPLKSSYRRYKIKTVLEQDDYSYMAEVLGRRYGKEDPELPLPDLLIVDGGKGQLNVAVSVLKETGKEGLFDVVGIAKKDESKGETQDKIFKPGRSNSLNFSRDEDLLFFLQNIRDEAHRFVIGFHRKRRSSKSLLSVLDAIPGIGAKRKKALLDYFGNISGVKKASLEEIKHVEGMDKKTAEAVFKSFSHEDSESST
jgi:excinuclease ABC subunit C